MKLGFYWARKPHHVSTFTQTQPPTHCQSSWKIRGHPDKGGSHDYGFNHVSSRYFQLNERESGNLTSLQSFMNWFMSIFKMKVAWTSNWNVKQMRSRSEITMNEDKQNEDRVVGIFWASQLAVRTCHFLGKLVTPLAQPATSPQLTGWLLCGFRRLTVNMSSTNENHSTANWWITVYAVYVYMHLCVCVSVCVCMSACGTALFF